MINIQQLFSKVADAFPILSEKVTTGDIDKEQIQNIRDELVFLGITESFHECVWSEIRFVLRHEVAPQFWSSFDPESLQYFAQKNIVNRSKNELEMQYKICEQFFTAVQALRENYCELVKLIDRLSLVTHEKTYTADLQKALSEVLLGQIPWQFFHIVEAFCYVSFKVYVNLHWNADSSPFNMEITMDKNDSCSGCNQIVEKCYCQALDELIVQCTDTLQYMELLDGIAGQTLTSLVQKCIQEHIYNTCYGIFDKSFLKQLEEWLDNVIIKWLERIFCHQSKTTTRSNSANIVKAFKVKLTYFLYENIAQSIIEQFFSIIIDFPDSSPAIDDLKICMEKIDMRKHLMKSLTSSIKARVLHPGVNTMDILTSYIAAIKSIRYLDSSGIILETVTAPMKEYLRKRSDTVRRVVTGLTEEGPTDLTEELAKGEALKENPECAKKFELTNWENWIPDPFGIEQTNRISTTISNTNRTTDIISMVVDIYGSKELFMNEYRNLMADRLLTQLDFNPDKEIRNLELLKLRFGDSLLHSCEVMLKDVTDSKRINAHIGSDAKYNDDKLFDISSLIISAQFWPSFNKENLELPEEIENEFKKYTKSYEAYKGNRTLNWRTVTGRVDLVIEIGGRVIEMTVPPTQAVILYHFQNKEEWTLEELSQITKVPSTILRRRIGFWQTHGLISEIQSGIFKLLEEEVQKSEFDNKRLNTAVDEDIESAMASASDQREEELQVFWSYIVGMLTNLDSLPIERIHQMLKLFASHGIGVEFTQDELKEFLQRKVREHKLIYSGGVYQLYK